MFVPSDYILRVDPRLCFVNVQNVKKSRLLFEEKQLTKARKPGIIANVDSAAERRRDCDGDSHNGSAVDSDSTCGSSILSSPTKCRSSTGCRGVFIGA